MASLTLKGVGKVYPSGVCALHDISLETDDREFIVIVGGEKCGKTSLLKIISGLEENTSGTVLIDGKDMTDVEPKDRDVAVVFRSDTLYPSLNVFDNMAFGLRLRKAPKALIEQRVKAAANILGLTEHLYRKPKVLSAAMRQRVAIARAIVREPKLYLFDEPLAGIDAALRRDMLNVIINLQARMQGTFIYATKNLSEALTIGTRLVILKNGLVQQIDTPANLYDYPANTYVAFFIGSPTINFIQNAKVLKEEQGYILKFEGGSLALAPSVSARFAKVGEYAESGKEVIVGIRPEDIKVGKEGLAAKLGKTESDGNATYAECTLEGGQSLIVTCEGDTQKGDVALAVDIERLYLFDSQTRLTLLSRDGGYVKTPHTDADRLPLPYPEEQAVIEKLKPKKDDLPKKKLR